MYVYTGILVGVQYIPIRQLDMVSELSIQQLSVSLTCMYLPRPWLG